MKNYKFLVILPYYNRPNMFRNCLKTFLEMTYDNWHVVVIDDVSDEDKKAAPILKEVFPDGICESKKYTLYEVDDTQEDKLMRGSIHSTYMNKAIREIEADYIITVCDDDGLYHDYLYNLNEYYNKNPEVVYSFAHVIPFDSTVELPCLETYNQRLFEIKESGSVRNFKTTSASWVNHGKSVNPVDYVDGTQVSWNRKKVLDAEIEYDESTMYNCDRDIFSKLFANFGECHYNGCIGPYKGFHEDQMGMRASLKQNIFTVKVDYNAE